MLSLSKGMALSNKAPIIFIVFKIMKESVADSSCAINSMDN